MQPGIYVLKTTIVNPQGDKRCTDRYWRRPKWEKGDKFAIYPYDEAYEWGQLSNPEVDVIEPLSGNQEKKLIGAKRSDERLALLLPELELLPESLFSILKTTHWTSTGVLDLLLKAGHIDLGQIKHLINQHMEKIAREQKGNK